MDNLYDQHRLRMLNGNAIDMDAPGGVGFFVFLVTNTEVPDQQNDDFFDDPSANEVSGTNYTADGNICSTPTLTGPTAAGLITFDANDPATWSQHASGFSNARRAILYWKNTAPAGADDPLISYSNAFSEDRGNVAGDFSVEFNTAGIYTSPR